MRDRLTADGIPYDEVSKVTPIEILVRGIPQDAETRTTLSDLIRDELLEWDLSGPTVQDGVASWRVRMRVTAARAIRLDALQKAISTIRRRVDALGVTEPTIQEHGQGTMKSWSSFREWMSPNASRRSSRGRRCWS